jgi:hypothetical protein
MDLGKLSELSEHRVCKECGAEFHSDKEQSALQKFSDHVRIHQPTPEQWTEAYNKIQEAKEKRG